jgi:hypothetical protein
VTCSHYVCLIVLINEMEYNTACLENTENGTHFVTREYIFFFLTNITNKTDATTLKRIYRLYSTNIGNDYSKQNIIFHVINYLIGTIFINIRSIIVYCITRPSMLTFCHILHDSDLRQVGDFLWVFMFPPTNKSDRHDITEILLKVVLNTITLTLKFYVKYYTGIYDRFCISNFY